MGCWEVGAEAGGAGDEQVGGVGRADFSAEVVGVHGLDARAVGAAQSRGCRYQ